MKLDNWLMDRTEAISHRIQRETGADCFVQARIVSALAVSGMVAACLRNLTFSGLDFLLLLLVGSEALGIRSATFWAKVREGHTANPLRVSMGHLVLRTIALALSIANSLAYLWLLAWPLPHLVFLLCTLHLYLEAVSPLPPCRGRLWESLEAGSMDLAEVEGGRK